MPRRFTLSPLIDLESPGAAFSHRVTVENALEPIWADQVRTYLSEMTEEIVSLGRVDSSTVHDAYSEIVIEGTMARIDGDEAGTDMVRQFLQLDPMADEVYDSAQTVLEVISPNEHREVLSVILDFDTPSAELEALSAAGFDRIARIAGRGAAAVAIGTAAGVAAPHVTQVVREYGPTWSRKIRGAARNAATAADNAMTKAQLRTTRGPHGSGYPYKMWVTRRDDRVRPSHSGADSQKVPLNSKFSVGGYDLDMPGDPGGPMHERAGCRCVVVGARD